MEQKTTESEQCKIVSFPVSLQYVKLITIPASFLCQYIPSEIITYLFNCKPYSLYIYSFLWNMNKLPS